MSEFEEIVENVDAPEPEESPEAYEPVEAPDPTDGVPESQRLGLPAKIEALLFLSPEPLTVGELVEACESSESKIEQALSVIEEDCQSGKRGIVLRQISGGY